MIGVRTRIDAVGSGFIEAFFRPEFFGGFHESSSFTTLSNTILKQETSKLDIFHFFRQLHSNTNAPKLSSNFINLRLGIPNLFFHSKAYLTTILQSSFHLTHLISTFKNSPHLTHPTTLFQSSLKLTTTFKNLLTQLHNFKAHFT